jgi:hypothetical protein
LPERSNIYFKNILYPGNGGPHHRSTTAQENSHLQRVLNMMPWLRSNVMQVSLSNHVSPGPTNESKSQTVSRQ